jgi:hypothetical protein
MTTPDTYYAHVMDYVTNVVSYAVQSSVEVNEEAGKTEQRRERPGRHRRYTPDSRLQTSTGVCCFNRRRLSFIQPLPPNVSPGSGKSSLLPKTCCKFPSFQWPPLTALRYRCNRFSCKREAKADFRRPLEVIRQEKPPFQRQKTCLHRRVRLSTIPGDSLYF